MNEKELKKLSRMELLELLVEKSRECDQLREQLDQANQQLASRKILLEETGNIAQAALALNHVFADAQAAADQYLENIKAIYDMQPAVRMKQEPESKSEPTNEEV